MARYAEPGVVGVSAGAALGAATAIERTCVAPVPAKLGQSVDKPVALVEDLAQTSSNVALARGSSKRQSPLSLLAGALRKLVSRVIGHPLVRWPFPGKTERLVIGPQDLRTAVSFRRRRT